MPYLSGHPAGVARPDVVHGQRRALKRRLQDAPAYFDHAFPGNGPTEAINGRLEHLRGIALGFTNLGNCITRSLLYAGGFRQTVRGANLTTMNPTPMEKPVLRSARIEV
ncbi:transposase [Bifidobacterium animalis subsp. lactis ATCC 27673]|nr:transposase [Bifidobacterium animalis subsp. lactis ATCC 27673]KOA46131.1 hypothetical protein BAAA27673_06545 [Bifidobacterium animalis subsp. lactis ATCC 27673]